MIFVLLVLLIPLSLIKCATLLEKQKPGRVESKCINYSDSNGQSKVFFECEFASAEALMRTFVTSFYGVPPKLYYRSFVDFIGVKAGTNQNDIKLLETVYFLSESLYSASSKTSTSTCAVKRQILTVLFDSAFKVVASKRGGKKGKGKGKGKGGKEKEKEEGEMMDIHILNLNIVKDCDLLHSFIFYTLTQCADALSAQEAVAIARTYPLIFSLHYDFVAQIQDFSAFTASDIQKCTDPSKYFSLFVFPAALKTLPMGALVEVLNQMDFDLSLDEFRQLVDIRGAIELLNAPELFENVLALPLLKKFLPSELDAAGITSHNNHVHDKFKPTFPWIHKHFGNVLSSDRIISIVNDSSVSNKQIKIAVLSHILIIESHISMIFTVLYRLYIETTIVNHIDKASIYLISSRIHYDLLKEALNEKEKLLIVVMKYRPKLYLNDLLKVPFDPLVRDSLVGSFDEKNENFVQFPSGIFLSNLQIYIGIWKFFNSNNDLLSYEIILIRSKYANPNQHAIIEEWKEQTKDTFRFKSGPTAEVFLALVTAHIPADMSTHVYTVARDFVTRNVLGKPNYAGLPCRWNFDSSSNEEAYDLNELDMLARDCLSKCSNFNIEMSANVDSNFMILRMAEHALSNKIRNLDPEYFVYLLTVKAQPGSSILSILNDNGPFFSDIIIEILLKSASGRVFLKTHKSMLHGLSSYAMFEREDFIELEIDFSALSVALHTIPVEELTAWIIREGGHLNTPVEFFEKVNANCWENDEFIDAAFIPLTGCLFLTILHSSPLNDIVIKSALPVLQRIISKYSEKPIKIVEFLIKFTISIESNFKQFLRSKKYEQSSLGVHAIIYQCFSSEIRMRDILAEILENYLKENDTFCDSESKSFINYFINYQKLPLISQDRINFLYENTHRTLDVKLASAHVAIIRKILPTHYLSLYSTDPSKISRFSTLSQMILVKITSKLLDILKDDPTELYVWTVKSDLILTSSTSKESFEKYFPQSKLEECLEKGLIPLNDAMAIYDLSTSLSRV